MSIKNFENSRWKNTPQKLVFRHTEALKMIDGGNALDIGCGDGLFLEMLKKENKEVYGVDISEEAKKSCQKRGIDVSLCDFSKDKLPFSDNQVDYVTILDVLEHLYSPDFLLKEAKRVSKKYIIISVPNFNSLPARLQVFFGKVPENNRPNKGHIYWFTYDNLFKMFKQNELSVVDVKTNTFFEDKFLIGNLTRFFAQKMPSLFALSFIIKIEK